MPLEILLALVTGGIAAIALLLHLFGYSAPLRLDDAGARRFWLREFPDSRPGAVHLADDGAAALIETDLGPGLVRAMGTDATAHLLTGAELEDRAAGLHIDLHDFAAPGLTVALSPQARDTWRRLIPTGTRHAPLPPQQETA